MLPRPIQYFLRTRQEVIETPPLYSSNSAVERDDMFFLLLMRILLGTEAEPLMGTSLVIAIIAIGALVWFAVLMEINSHYGDNAAIYFLLGTGLALLLRWACRRHAAKVRG